MTGGNTRLEDGMKTAQKGKEEKSLYTQGMGWRQLDWKESKSSKHTDREHKTI